MSIATDRLKELVEDGHPESIAEACEVIARCVINGVSIDDRFLLRLGITCIGKAADIIDEGETEEWARLIFTCVDYIERKEVILPDGRLATECGWDYSRCKRDGVHVSIAQPVVDRLEAHVRSITDEEPANDPENSPSEFDKLYDATVEKALVEFFRVKEVKDEPE